MQNNCFSKKKIADTFSHAVHTYDQTAVLQCEIADRLIERFQYMSFMPQRILDIGSATGIVTKKLQAQFPKAHIIGIDLSMEMVKFASKRKSFFSKIKYLCADAEKLPFQDNYFDLVFSSSTFQWCQDIKSLFSGIYRVLKDDGLLLFSSFGPDTLKELKEGFKMVDDHKHINRFIDLHVIGDQLVVSGFNDPVMDMEIFTMQYSSVKQLMRELKHWGANMVFNRSQGLMTPRMLKKLEQSYKKQDDCYLASFEVINGTAWKKEHKENKYQYQIPAEHFKTYKD